MEVSRRHLRVYAHDTFRPQNQAFDRVHRMGQVRAF